MQDRLLMGRRAFGLSIVSLGFSRVANATPSLVRDELLPGTPWRTATHRIDAGAPGPTVMIVAGIHGNEPAPPVAAARLTGERILRGRLLVIPEANKPALRARTRHSPRSTRPDLNRNFPTGGRAEARDALSRALWLETVALAPDWVLDLHEGWGFSAASASMGSSVVVVPDPRVDDAVAPVAERVLATVNATVTDPKKRFTRLEPGPLGSYARAVTEQLGKPSLVLETTWSQPLELRVEQQLLMVRSVLRSLGMCAPP